MSVVFLRKFLVNASFVLCLCSQNIYCSDISVDSADDDTLLSEDIMEKLREVGYDGNFSFFGDAEFCAILCHQTVSDDNENRNLAFRSNIYLKYLDILNGCAYGFQLGCKPQSNFTKNHEALFKSLYGFVKSDYLGEFRAGFIDTAANDMCIDGYTFAVGFQGPGSGDFRDFYNPAAGSIVDTGCSVDDGKAAKLVWYSPIIRGFSIGASYTFNGKRYAPFRAKHDELSCEYDECWAHSKNVLTVAGAYEYGSSDKFNAKFSLAGWFGEGKAGSSLQKVHGICAYQIGTILGYKNFKIAFGFTDNGKSLISKRIAEGECPKFDLDTDYNAPVLRNRIGLKSGADAGKIYSVGLLYNIGNLKLSSGYFRSIVKYSDLKQERAISNIVTLAAEYELKKSIKIYAEFDNIVSNTCERAMVFRKTYKMPYTGSNKANVFMIGTKFDF